MKYMYVESLVLQGHNQKPCQESYFVSDTQVWLHVMLPWLDSWCQIKLCVSVGYFSIQISAECMDLVFIHHMNAV